MALVPPQSSPRQGAFTRSSSPRDQPWVYQKFRSEPVGPYKRRSLHRSSVNYRPFFLGKLLGSTRECRDFFLPNGNFRDADSHGEVLDYATGVVRHCDFSEFGNTPAPLPPSETEGLTVVDVQSNVFGNLPLLPSTIKAACPRVRKAFHNTFRSEPRYCYSSWRWRHG